MVRMLLKGGALAGAVLVAFTLGPRIARTAAGAGATPLPSPATDEHRAPGPDELVVVLSGGCFWGVQAVYEHVNGVLGATAGYTGGAANTASYGLVSTGSTGHAESVRVIYDPSEVTFGQLLEVFFSVAHDPTQLNRQGPDHGTQYRSAIWYTTVEQQRVAEAYISQLAEAEQFSRPIVTEVNALTAFYAAEAYHQDYLIHHPHQPYIVIYDLPKLDDLRRMFPALWRERPVVWQPETTSRR